MSCSHESSRRSTRSLVAALSLLGSSLAVTTIADAARPVKLAAWDPSPVEFGDLATFTAMQETVTFTNIGTKTLRKPIVSLSNATGSGITIVSNGCEGLVLRPNDSCNVELRFGPTSNSAQSATLSATAARETWSVPVSGTGVSLPAPTAVVAGYLHSCAILVDGGVACWGSNDSGELGDGTLNARSVRARVTGISSGATALALGVNFSCAIVNGGVKCWGNNQYGQLGDGSTTSRTTPVDVTGLTSGVAAIAVGYIHSCALLTSGGVKCWGGNNHGQIGDGTGDTRTTPVDVTGLTSGVASLDADGEATCVVTIGGEARCWGANYFGQLGDGSLTSRSVSVGVNGLASGVASIAVGDYYGCAVTTTGAAMCWGNNFDYRLGVAGVGDVVPTPVDVTGLGSGVAVISAGGSTTCAITVSGGAKCWGAGTSGQLGDGTFTPARAENADVTGLTSGVATISVGGAHVCAMVTSVGVRCWGLNAYGALGDNSTVNRSLPTAPVW